MNEPSASRDMSENPVRRWLKVWHTIYIGGLLICTAVALWESRGEWGLQTVAMLAIIALLIVLYLRLIAFYSTWPPPLWQRLLYFAIEIGLWLALLQINSIFNWISGMIIGQMFGILPAAAALPGALIMVALISMSASGWQIPQSIAFSDVLVVGVQIGFLFLGYLYIYSLIRNNQERTRLVEQLQAANDQLARAQAQEAELAALRERERVARDLHDGLGHSLVTLSVQLEAIQRLYRVNPERASKQVDELKQLTRDSMTLLRRTLDGLRIDAPAGQPLESALVESCAALSRRTGLTVNCEVDPAAASLPPTTAEALWWVSQEALANIERHAAATAVSLRLQVSPEAITLCIEDNGVGLATDTAEIPGHYGLRGMRERVEALGGTLIVSSNGHKGTIVSAVAPLLASPRPPREVPRS